MGAFLWHVPGPSSALREAICPVRAVLRVTPKCKCLTEKRKYFKPFTGTPRYQHPCQQMEQSSTSLQSIQQNSSPLPSSPRPKKMRWVGLEAPLRSLYPRAQWKTEAAGRPGSGAEKQQPSHPPARGECCGATPSPGRGSEPGTNIACACGQSREQGKPGTERRPHTLLG